MAIGGKIIHYSTVSSTNDLARELALQGEAEGTAVLADEQTKGRGTKGRIWYSAAGLGLYVSVILRPSRREITLLPLTAGLAVREALARAVALEVRLKWPNDLIWQGRKLGGILLESEFCGETPSYVILGIGINLGHRAEDFPEEIRSWATSLRMACGREIPREELLPPLWEKLGIWYRAFLEGKDEEIIRAFELYNIFLRGEEITVEAQGGLFRGRFLGLNCSGALCLETAGKKLVLTAGEVVRMETG